MRYLIVGLWLVYGIWALCTKDAINKLSYGATWVTLMLLLVSEGLQ